MGYNIRVKICGVTTPEDARVAVAAGADAIGVNFYPKSPRYVTAVVVNEILNALSPFVEAVGVFAAESPQRMVQQALAHPRLRSIQCHGSWPPPADVHPYGLILAAAIEDAESVTAVSSYLERCRLSGQLPIALLADARVTGLYGGTGQTAPWGLLAKVSIAVPLILAGGLTPENVAEAIRIVRPYAVDVASGIETAPGKKDPHRLRRFIENARKAAVQLPDTKA